MSIASGKELTTTLGFVAAAVFTMFIAVTTRPVLDNVDALDDGEVGTALFPELNDTAVVTGLEVLSFNEELGALKPFKIEQAREGEWIIPSRQGYPADAQDRVARAATMFVDLKISNVVQDPDFQELGVVEPKYGETKVGDQGVGTLFKVTGQAGDQSNATLAELIIGKPVKDLAGQYYVRRPGKTRVYRVEIDPSELSTEFVDWIDRALLPFPASEISSLGVRNYAVLVQDTAQGGKSLSLAKGGYEAELQPNDDGTWNLSQLQVSLQGKLMNSRLGTGEELNQERIAQLISAISAVEVADVQRMPDALASKMKIGETQIDTPESSQSLAMRGFYPIKFGEDPGRLFASQGELLIRLAAGIEFRLLFGALAEQNVSASSALNRYLIIAPQIEASAFPAPELEELPPEDAEMSENDRKIAVDRITKANQRKQEEYQERRGNVENIVRTLQQRYGEWFYLVPEEVVRNLRLPRTELAGLSQKALEEGFGIEAFRMLETKGLDPQVTTEQ